MKRLIQAMLVLAVTCGVASAEYRQTYYLKGFSQRSSAATAPYAQSGGTVASIVDSIPFGTTFTSRWIPIAGARQVTINIRATAADSDSVVRVLLATVDTASSIAAVPDTTGAMSGNLSQGVSLITSYRGTGGTTWGPTFCKLMNLVPFHGSSSGLGHIPVRWIRLEVTAPTRLCVGPAEGGQACNSMHGVRIWVDVVYDDQPRGQDAYYPFSGATTLP